MARKRKQALVITVSGDRQIHEVARELKAAGFDVNQVLDTIGVVTGSADATSVARLRSVRGVTDVSPDHEVDIGPPGTPIS
jgi:hypothetical protein